MRVLAVVHEFLPKHNAGTERYTYDLCQELRRGNEVRVLAGERDAARKPCMYRDEVLDGLPVRRLFLPHRHHYRETYRNPGLDTAFSDLLSDFRPDIIHFQHLIYLSTTFVELAAARGIPVVMTLHDYWLMCPMGQLMRMQWESNPSSGTPGSCQGPEGGRCLLCMCPPLGYLMGRGIRKRLHRPTVLASDVSRIGRVLLRADREEVRNMFGPVKARMKGDRYLDMKDILEREAAVRELVERVHLFISPSSFLRDRFTEWGIPSVKIIHLDNGTETQPFERYRSERRGKVHYNDRGGMVNHGGKRTKNYENGRGSNKGMEKVKFGFVGTVKAHKGSHVLLEALGEMKHREKARVVIYGDMKGDPAYSEHLRRLGCDLDVEFGGRFDEAEKPEIYSNMDALVVPSLWYENSPVTIHEAFASETPVIASDIGGIGELVKDSRNGMLFEAGNVLELSECMDRFTKSSGLREELRKGVPKVKNMKDHARELMALYGKVL